jgi:predicted ribosome quality control (RQC) complex YloA/Tae2 family protein
MIRHASTLQRVANELNRLLAGATLIDIFSPEKYALALIFETSLGQHVNVYASVHPQTGRVSVRRSIGKPRTNLLQPFSDRVGDVCHAVTKHPDDRIISFWFPSHILHVLLFGGGSGNMLVTSDGIVVDALKHRDARIGHPLHLPPVGTARSSWYDDVVRTHPDLADQIETSSSYFVLDVNGRPTFSVVYPPGTTVLNSTDNIFEAIERTVALRLSRQSFDKQRRNAIADTQHQLAKAEKALAALQTVATQVSKAPLLQHEADLLLSLPDVHRLGQDSVDVTDTDGTIIHIRLDPRLSILDNATERYRKAKDADRAREERLERLPVVEREVTLLRERLRNVERATSLEDLTTSSDAPRTKPPGRTPSAAPVFRQFELDHGWTLYVGRNAANNDELTMRFAKPHDWWFHARNVQGSHAVLRSRSPHQKPSPAIIDAAAAVAAWYSAARNSTWVPVIVTQKKWVRKPRKAPLGAVAIEREQVVLVQPGLPKISE